MSASLARADGEPRRLSILGATGSIGCSTLDLVTRNPAAYEVEVLTAYRNVDALARQARTVDATLAVVGDANLYKELRDSLSGTKTEVAADPMPWWRRRPDPRNG